MLVTYRVLMKQITLKKQKDISVLSVCLFPNSSETANPKELKFWGMISPWGADGFRLKKLSDLNWKTEIRRKTKKTNNTSDSKDDIKERLHDFFLF